MKFRFAVVCLAVGCGAPRPATAPASHEPAALREARRLALQGRLERAEAALGPALEAARRSGDSRAETRLLIELGRVRYDTIWHRGSSAAAALEPLERARALAQAGGDRALLGEALDAIGMIYYSKHVLTNEGSWAQVDAYFARAAPLLAETGEEDRVHFHLGLMRQERGEDEPARVELERALSAASAGGDRLYMSYAQRHLAALAGERGDVGRALELHRACLANREAVGFVAGAAMAHVAIGDLLVKAAREGEARAHFAKALELGRAAGSVRVRSSAAASLARLGLRERRYDEARRHAAEAVEASEAGRHVSGLVAALAIAAEARAGSGDCAGAEGDLRRAYALARRDAPHALGELDRVAREQGLASAGATPP